MTGMLKAFTIPLVAVTKLIRTFGSGFLEAVIAYKIMNKVIPVNSMVLAKNINMLMKESQAQQMVTLSGKQAITVKEADAQITALNTQLKATQDKTQRTKIKTDLAELTIARSKIASNLSVAGSLKAILASQMAVNLVMFAAMYITQKYAKDNVVFAATVGALAGAFVGLSIAINMARAAGTGLKDMGAEFYATVASAAFIGAGFNVLMTKMMTPPKIDYSEYDVMDTGGRFMPRARTYDMGGYTPEHGMAMLQKGETVIPKTQNMLEQGITINMGDVYANDGTDFADKLADELPLALQRVSDRGGI